MVNMLKFLLLGIIMLVVSAQDIVTPCTGKDDCCDGILCGINEGDCDSHENCAGHLRCGVDNCDGPDFDSTDDCCWNDPLFPPPSPAEDFEMCEIVRDLEKKIAQAAVAQGCDLPEGRPESLSLNECVQVSCSTDLIGKSFTCNNQNKEKTCKELLSLLDAIVIKKNTQCSQLLRTITDRRYGSVCGESDYIGGGKTCGARYDKCYNGWCDNDSSWACSNQDSDCYTTDGSFDDHHWDRFLNGTILCNNTNAWGNKDIIGGNWPTTANTKIYACKTTNQLFITYEDNVKGEHLKRVMKQFMTNPTTPNNCLLIHCENSTSWTPANCLFCMKHPQNVYCLGSGHVKTCVNASIAMDNCVAANVDNTMQQCGSSTYLGTGATNNCLGVGNCASNSIDTEPTS